MSLRRSILAFVLAAPALVADVIEVPAVQPTIQAGVDAAQPGDIVLVAPGDYAEGVFVVGKGISLVADGSVDVARLEVRDVPAGQTVLVDGFDIALPVVVPGFEVALLLEDNAGSIRVQDCDLFGTRGFAGIVFGPMGYDGFPAARVVGCDDVAFVDGSARGGDGDSLSDEDVDGTATSGAAAIEVVDSRVVVDDVDLTGGEGGDVLDTVTDPGGTGGSGVDASDDALVFVVGCTIVGGDGGDADCDFIGCGFGGGGGHGVRLTDGASAVVRDVDFTPGIGGLDGDFQTKADDGQLAAEFGGTARLVDDAARDLRASTPVREGGGVTLVVNGEPGDAVFLYASLSGGWKPLGGGEGAILLGPPFVFTGLALGTLPSGGLLIAPFTVPELGPGIEGLDVQIQGFFDTGTKLLVGSARTITLLDAAF